MSKIFKTKILKRGGGGYIAAGVVRQKLERMQGLPPVVEPQIRPLGLKSLCENCAVPAGLGLISHFTQG